MKNMRIPLLIAWGVAVIGIILGSFFDLNISSAIASPDNNFALTVSAIGPTIGFAGVAAMGGGFVAFIIKGKYRFIGKSVCIEFLKPIKVSDDLDESNERLMNIVKEKLQ